MVFCYEKSDQMLQDQAESLPRDELLHELVSSLPFQESLRYRFKQPAHINILDGQAWFSRVKWLCTQQPAQCLDRRLRCINDSQVWCKLCNVIQRGEARRVTSIGLRDKRCHGTSVTA
eukprot:1806648-Amphidinium_carterae.3